jgi:hypothetical protein
VLRAIAIIGLWLLIGAATNVVVAWGLAISGSMEWLDVPPIQTFSLASDAAWLRPVPAGWPPPQQGSGFESRWWRYRSLVAERWPDDRSIFGRPGPADGQYDTWTLNENRYGWPRKSLATWGTSEEHELSAMVVGPSGIKWTRTPVGAPVPGRLHAAWVLPFEYGSKLALPLRPAFPGFGFNTVFYGALAWMVVRGPVLLQRWRRRRTGRCIRCGYNLAGLPPATPCPECGHQTRAQ